jgi:drug/metabolite transporter (DMT)-like permease
VSRRRIYLLLSCVVISWGGAFTAIRILVQDASVFTVSFLRFVLTTLGLVAVSAVMRPEWRPVERADRGKVVVLALTGVAIYHVSLNYGERFVSADVASLIVASMPVMVALLSRFFLKERIGPTKWLGIFVALTGVVVLITKGVPGARLEVESLGGAAVVALAPLSWAIYTIVSKPLVSKYGPLPLVTGAMALGTLMLAPLGIPAALHDLGGLSLGDWGWLAFLAVACSTFAYAVWFYALEVLSPSEVAVWVYFVPLAALVWAAVVLDERLTWFIGIGGALVLAGVVLTERVAVRVDERRADEMRATEPATD